MRRGWRKGKEQRRQTLIVYYTQLFSHRKDTDETERIYVSPLSTG